MPLLTHKTFKYRLYPNKTQAAKFDEWLWLNRELYNAALEERIEAWKRQRKSIGLFDQQKAIPEIRAARPEFYGIPVIVMRATLQRLDRAFQAFFRRLKMGGTPGFPRFQGRGRFNSFTYQQVGHQPSFENSRVVLSMVGDVKIRLHRPLEGTVKTITVSREGTHWYICFNCVLEVAEPEPTPATAIGIDLGLEKFATFSTGEQVPNPRFLRRSEARLKAEQQKLSRCKNGSNRRKKQRGVVTAIHRKIRHQRDDFLHKLSRRLVDEYGTVVLEDLTPANMSKRPKVKPTEDGTGYEHNGAAAKSGLNKSINDAGWAMFKQMCVVKAEWAGRRVLLVNPRYTSQTCSGCGQIRKKDLSERWHSCECGTELDRDHNAAINILRLGVSQRLVITA